MYERGGGQLFVLPIKSKNEYLTYIHLKFLNKINSGYPMFWKNIK